MTCILVVSADPPPQIEGDISKELAATANLSSTQPPVVTILPSSSFHFDFRQDSFIDIVRRKLYYYSTLTDHTPLPSWLMFDSQNLTFSGTAPQLSAFPQSWNIDLIASDVEGFAGATASFSIAISLQQLVFVPEAQQVNILAGVKVDFTSLGSTLFMNGHVVSPGDLKIARASVPSWLSFDSTTLAMTGVAPTDATDQNVTVAVEDKFGDRATATVSLVVGTTSLITGTIGTLTATCGQAFNYHLSRTMFAKQDLHIMVVLPETVRWLHFDASSETLSGSVPTQTTSSTIEATLMAKSSDLSEQQTQTFSINIKPVTSKATLSNSISSHTSATDTPTSSSAVSAGRSNSRSQLTAGVVAAIVVGVAIFVALLITPLAFCWRRRRDEGYVEAASPAKRTISRPILAQDADAITVTTEVQTDIEKIAEGVGPAQQMTEGEPAPQIALDLPRHANSRILKWSKRFSRISQVSSLGSGEDAIKKDSNIPEWGRESAALHTPHDSFSVPAEIARSSRQLTELSPCRGALKRLREKRRSRQSIGLGIDRGGVGLFPWHSSQGARSHRRAVSSLGLSAAADKASLASMSTRGTSVLSTRPSEFPRPPTRSTYNGSRSIPTLSLTEVEKRRSIRLVGRSDSVNDERSMQEKRQSFIRNRASTSFASPLFAHGSRASSNTRQNGQGSVHASSSSSQKRPRRGRSHLTTYSESSSLEPTAHNSRRFSTRVRSAFAPSFPRAVTRSSLGVEDDDGIRDSSSDYYTTSSSLGEVDLAAEMALPRHQRDWVVPGEASPTPPPAPPTFRQASSAKRGTPPTDSGKPRQKWKERLREHPSSPLSTATAVPVADRNSLTASAKASQARRSRLSEPLSLVSNDSLSRSKLERPRLVHTSSKRPVSVEKVQKLSSLKAETEDARPGSEMWEAMEGAGLMPLNCSDGKENTQKSNLSGPAFL